MVKITLSLALLFSATTVAQDRGPHAGMLRTPDVSRTQVVFSYAGDLWIVSREGGTALPLSSPPGAERSPRFSPDGSQIAFVGNYEGNEDLYVIPAQGGEARRVTYHGGQEFLCDWIGEESLLYFSNAFTPTARLTELYSVSASGGVSTKLPVPYGANGAISPDGKWLAYTPVFRDMRTWKRYRGGMAADVWLFNLEDHSSRKVSAWEGTDSQPMWHGEDLYYLSDAGPEHRLNLWHYDLASGRSRQVTTYSDFDVKWPAMGPESRGAGEVVFQLGSELVLLDLETGRSRTVPVQIPGDAAAVRAQLVDASEFVSGMDVSPSGKRAAAEARGDIWSLPASKGIPRNLTRTASVAERGPSWSPDGKWIAFFSDASGEYELCITQSDGKGETRTLTQDSTAFLSDAAWSPNSRYLTYQQNTGEFRLHDLETGETRTVDTLGLGAFAGTPDPQWSHDSRWMVYSRSDANLTSVIMLYEVETSALTQITSGMFNDSSPTFDRKGEMLFYASGRHFQPTRSAIDTTFVYTDTQRLLAVPLRADVAHPWPLESDEEAIEDKQAADGEESADPDEAAEGDAAKEGAAGEEVAEDEDKEAFEIEVEDLEARAIELPPPAGSYRNLRVNDKGQLLYLYSSSRSPGMPAIKLFDLADEKKEVKDVAPAAFGFTLTPDGKKLLLGNAGSFSIQDAKEGAKAKQVPTDGMTVAVDLKAEWRQVFRDAWRLQRQLFYDPHMHGVDWDSVYEQYAPMIGHCASRGDVEFVIGEMISELNVGHAYARGAPGIERGERRSVGLLGVDFERNVGAYRFARIYRGAPWDSDARSPFDRAGVDVQEGDYLRAVNGIPLDPNVDPWAAFQGLAGRLVSLTICDEATGGETEEILVETLSEGADRNLRFRDWIERNRSYVAEKSGGRIGYVYVPDTQVNGQNNLMRQLIGNQGCEALIVDERWNSGGQIPTRFVELLNRPATNYWAVRGTADLPWPPFGHRGPKCMLINGWSGSGGDAFPAYFRQAGLGKLVGRRTWGGLVGISGAPHLIDGGQVTVPTFAFYELDGTWGIEGHGVEPDIEVIDDPALMVDGSDPQLDAAIEHMESELKRRPYRAPDRPSYPKRAGMGVAEPDK